MTLYEKYNDIFQKEIIEKSNGIIFSYFPLKDQYYFPYSHAISEVMKNKPCKCIIPKKANNKNVVKKCNAEERPNADYEILR